MKTRWIFAALLLLCPILSGAEDLEFLEKFALSKDRSQVLDELVPGTEDYQYFRSLYDQSQGNLEAVASRLEAWQQRHGKSPRWQEIRNRQAFLEYDQSPQKTLQYLKNTFQLQFDHQQQKLAQPEQFPSQLDPQLISAPSLKTLALQKHTGLQGFEDHALEELWDDSLSPTRLREWLRRMKRPDHPRLASLVVQDLRNPRSRGFGHIPIHQQMLRSQLDEARQLLPELAEESRFVHAYLRTLWPSDEEDWKNNPALTRAYFERLSEFLNGLSPSFSSLKAQVLYHRLDLDRREKIYNRELFLEYLNLPRDQPSAYLPKKASRKSFQLNTKKRAISANLRQDFRNVTLLPPVGNEEPLIRDYLHHFLAPAEDFSEYAPYLENDYLREVFAETKILDGIGDGERWATMLSAEKYRALQERVDLEFALSNPVHFAPDAPVELEVFVKNVSQLILRVYEINTTGYYRQNGKPIELNVQVEGLVANEEQIFTYEESPFRRVLRSFKLDSLSKRGVYVVELIGNGKSSRALIRKGQIRFTGALTVAGHRFTLFDETHHKISDGSLWLSGHEYHPDDNGYIWVPFSSRPQSHPIVLTHGNFSSLGTFSHASEIYSLSAGLYIDREQLIAGQIATLWVRPTLYLNQQPVTLSFLEDTELVLETVDTQGISSIQTVTDFELKDDLVALHQFRVPSNLAMLQVTLRTKMPVQTQNDPIVLSDEVIFPLNQIDQTALTKAVLLQKNESGYVLEALGKNGEPKPHRPMVLLLKHKDFQDPVSVALQTDQNGQIRLGELVDIQWLETTLSGNPTQTWPLLGHQISYSTRQHHPVNRPILIPYESQEPQTRKNVALLKRHGNRYVSDHFDAIQWEPGFLKITGLLAGNYELFLKSSQTLIQLQITDGVLEEDILLTDLHMREASSAHPLQIESVTRAGEQLHIQLQNHSPKTRVHVVAVRYLPTTSLWDLWQVPYPNPQSKILQPPTSTYHSERRIGDEYRYILERQYAQKFPGTLLPTPGLLLNPMSVRDTEAQEERAQAGEMFDIAPPSPAAAPSKRLRDSRNLGITLGLANLNFLSDNSVVLANLKPNEDGLISIDLATFENRSHVHIVAIEGSQSIYRDIVLPESTVELQDLRLANSFDAQRNYSQLQQISVLQPGDSLTIEDVSATRWELYDDLQSVYDLYATLHTDQSWQEFQFLPQWHHLDPKQKLEQYSKYASHEVHFFLFHHDRPFFEEVIRPHLANKIDPDFFDDWLLENDLTPYQELWRFETLNLLEKILLAQKTPEMLESVRRYVDDWWETIPDDPDQQSRLFQMALNRGNLEIQLMTLSAEMPPMPSDSIESVSEAMMDELEMEQLSQQSQQQIEMAPRGLKAKTLQSKTTDLNAFQVAQPRPFFQQLDQTKEWVETYYYQLARDQKNPNAISMDRFWRDYAHHDSTQGGFISKNFLEAASNFTEMALALALLALPLEATAPEVQRNGDQLTLTARTPLIVVHQTIQQSEVEADASSQLFVNRNYFKRGDRSRQVGNESHPKYVEGEFLVDTVYGSEIILTNLTAIPQKVDLLVQIPQGSLPIWEEGPSRSGTYQARILNLLGASTKNLTIRLEPFATSRLEYQFYFPSPGEFNHYPAHVTQQQKTVAKTSFRALVVKESPQSFDQDSWDFVSQQGTDAQVLRFLESKNLRQYDLNRIAFRLRDHEFFTQVLEVLATRHRYDSRLWSYSVYHNDQLRLREFLENSHLMSLSGYYLQSTLVSIDAVERLLYEHKEYYPLVNARAHRLGSQRQILNDRLQEQYRLLLLSLSQKARLDDKDYLAMIYYFILQNRIDEALALFRYVQPENIHPRLQYDYLDAYLAFFQEEPDRAKTIAAQYRDYPVKRWRERFDAILEETTVEATSRDQRQTQLAASEPSFDLQIDNQKIWLAYNNLTECKVNYYPMDVELLFSRNPFTQQNAKQLTTIRPHMSQTVSLPEDQRLIVVESPGSLANRNLIIEAVCGGQQQSLVYYSHSLIPHIAENYGQLQITDRDGGQPLSKVYVKVYAEYANGEIRFYKDGYTDYQGRFDYVSLNQNQLSQIRRFALLLLSETHGTVIRTANVPEQ